MSLKRSGEYLGYTVNVGDVRTTAPVATLKGVPDCAPGATDFYFPVTEDQIVG